MTSDQTTSASLSELQAEYRRLAYADAQGDAVAAKELASIEKRSAEVERDERRRAAAEAEQMRQTALAAEKAAQDAMAAAIADHEAWLEAKERAYASIQDVTEDLVSYIKIALEPAGEAHAAALRRGVPPGRRANDELMDYLSWRLGREGAGLTDMPPVFASMRQPLVSDNE